MDDRHLSVAPSSALPMPQTSVEKVEAALVDLSNTQPDNGLQSALVLAFAGLQPMVRQVLPEDPAELDALLLIGARMCLGLRSDDAEQPESINELFGIPGPDPDDDAPTPVADQLESEGLLCKRCDVFVGWGGATTVNLTRELRERGEDWLASHCWVCERSADEIREAAR